MPNFFKELRSHSVTGINAKNTGVFDIATTDNGSESFHPLFVLVVVNSASAITIAPTISVGTNAATYNNITAATLMTGLTAVGTLLQIPIVAAVSRVAANTSIKGNVTVAATATTATVDIHVFGFYN